jgi:predicted membrane-bound spermidine synthase
MTETPAVRAIGRRTLFTIFTLSGFSGLIYESIWSHYLKLFLGHAAYAQTLVLTVFMGGMAIGAWLAARYSPKMRNLLLGYALVEVITGAIALFFHPIYLGGTGFTFESVIPALDSPAAINLAKWLIAALLILPQSVLLGSTFPLISGAVVRRFPDKPGTTLAMLYFTNSLGAALGVLASGFLLIGWVGLPGTVVFAGLMNVAIAVYVWRKTGPEPEPPSVTVAAPAAEDRGLARTILLAAFLSGAAAFIYEIAWIRMLSLALGSSTHAFELMLSAFILGLAFGGLWIRRRIDSLTNPLATLATLFAVMAFLAACTLPAYGYTFDIIGAAVREFPRTEAGYGYFNLVSHGVAALIMIPTTFVAGMTLPVMTHTLLRRADERAIGRVYACNTVGAIAGVLVAVHLMLPYIGVKGAVIAGAILQLAIALLFMRQQTAPSDRRRLVAMAASGALVALIALFVQLDPMRMASGVYRNGNQSLPDDAEVTFLRDGKTSTITLVRGGDIVSIATNGKPDAAINMGAPGNPNGDEITMVLAAVLPLAMHADARHIANIGIGSGLTSHVVLGAPEVARLDSIEIEPVIAQAARIGFGPRVQRLFEDPRSQIHYEDAKTFFAAAKRRYDVIISEPSNPWVSGVASLFSDEFYAQILGHLNPGGIMVQWIQVYETDITVVGSIMKALGAHFEDYAVYGTDNSNILIVATPSGRLPEIKRDLFAIPALAAELRLAGLETMGDIEIRRIGNKRMLHPLMATLPLPANSDFHPYVDLNAARMRFMRRDAIGIIELAMLPVPLAEIFGEPLVQPTSESLISAGFYTRHRLAIESRAIVNALSSDDQGKISKEAADSLNALQADAADCQKEEVRHAWLDAVHSLASSTTPYLTQSERIPLWKAVREQGCANTLSPAEAAWLGLMEANARGNAAEVAAQGEVLFTSELPELRGPQILEALIATTAAKIVTGNRDDANALLRAYLPDLKDPGEFGLALRLVMSHARPPKVD